MTDRKYFGEFPIHPGFLIDERFVKPSGKSQAEISRQSGIGEGQLSRVLGGKAAVSTTMARDLGLYFNVSAMIFLELQNRYDLSLLEYKEANPDQELPRMSSKAR